MTVTAEIIARLEAGVPALVQVRGAAEFAALDQRLTQVPAAFVLPMQDRPRGSDRAHTLARTTQIVRRTYGIVLADRRHGDPLGGDRAEDIEPLRDAVRAALLGWMPASAHEALAYDGGQISGLRNSEIWWTDRYITAILYQGP